MFRLTLSFGVGVYFVRRRAASIVPGSSTAFDLYRFLLLASRKNLENLRVLRRQSAQFFPAGRTFVADSQSVFVEYPSPFEELVVSEGVAGEVICSRGSMVCHSDDGVFTAAGLYDGAGSFFNTGRCDC